MEDLTTRDRELVAIGAASNCLPCIENHIPKAREAGLSDSEIKEAVTLADEVRKVPAAKVLNTALTILGESSEMKPDVAAKPCCGARERSL